MKGDEEMNVADESTSFLHTMLRDHVISSSLLALLLSNELGDMLRNVSSSYPNLSELVTFRASESRNSVLQR